MKKALVTGASGLLGRPIVRELREAGWEVQGIAFKRINGGTKRVDLCDEEAVRTAIQEYKPSVIVHAAAERHPDIVEENVAKAELLNVDASRIIAEEAAKLSAWMIYVSSDYVFDGTQPPYKEDATPNPLNTYGKTKLMGELAVKDVLKEDYCILRLPVLYGELEYLHESAITDMLRHVIDAEHRCTFSDYEKRYPTLTDDVAVVIRQLAAKKLEDPSLSGIFHWSGNERLTRYMMVEQIAGAFSLPMYHIEPNPTPVMGAPRPYNACLDCGKLEALGIGRRTPFRDGIRRCLQPYVDTMLSLHERESPKNGSDGEQ